MKPGSQWGKEKKGGKQDLYFKTFSQFNSKTIECATWAQNRKIALDSTRSHCIYTNRTVLASQWSQSKRRDQENRGTPESGWEVSEQELWEGTTRETLQAEQSQKGGEPAHGILGRTGQPVLQAQLLLKCKL